jgi:CDP-paratose 2-epimerase
MSCIYGPHQQGNEDQGWVAHFVKQALAGQPITIYGDGRQVRDVLYVDDLLHAMVLALADIDRVAGKAFNMGGGPQSTVSLLELLDLIAELTGQAPEVDFDDWRIGDQRWYVSDTRRFAELTGWAPQVRAATGIAHLHDWLQHAGQPRTAVEAS